MSGWPRVGRRAAGVGWPGLALLGLLLVGCAKSPPVPTDRFYRLPEPAGLGRPPAAASEADRWLGRVVLVRPFRADGVHNERAVTYAEDPEALALERYSYHLWVDSPARMLQEHVAARLRLAAPGSLVLTERGASPDLTVSGKIKRFEHHRPSGGPARALVSLELAVERGAGGNPILLRDYRVSEPVAVGPDPGAPMMGTVSAFGRALDRMMEQFIADLRKAIQ